MSVYHFHDWVIVASVLGIAIFWLIVWFGDNPEYKAWVRMMEEEERKEEREKHWTNGLDMH